MSSSWCSIRAKVFNVKIISSMLLAFWLPQFAVSFEVIRVFQRRLLSLVYLVSFPVEGLIEIAIKERDEWPARKSLADGRVKGLNWWSTSGTVDRGTIVPTNQRFEPRQTDRQTNRQTDVCDAVPDARGCVVV